MELSHDMLSLETQAAIKVGVESVTALVLARDDLIILTDFMADEAGCTAREVADAVERPWKYRDELAEAKAALTAAAAALTGRA